MNAEKKSKRQERREKVKQQEARNRMWTILLIVVGVAFVVFAFIWPSIRPIADIVTVTPNPRPNAHGNSMGSADAPIQITEFSDFQCPYCKRFFKDTEALLVQYYVSTGKVKFTYHSAGNWVSGNIGKGSTESQDAAAAAYCAADQNKFWEMHDALFANDRDVEDEGSFVPRRLTEIAKSAGLDMATYQSCYDSGKYKSQVQQDFADATAANIQGTPFFLISYTVNGVTKTDSLDGAQPFSAFQVKLEAILNEIGAK